jgi:hypothetical protein
MKVTAYGTLVFFICLNLSLYFLNTTQVLPNYRISPFEDPTGIQGQMTFIDISAASLIGGLGVIGVGFLIGAMLGRLVLGATLGLIVFTLTLLGPPIQWILFGFPTFLAQIGVHFAIVTLIETLMAVVWFWFLLGFIGQRSTWEQ